jgi:hypothetical protein
MTKTKKLAELQQVEKPMLEPKELLDPSKEIRVLVKPELFEQVFQYLQNSIPKNHTVNEINNLINNLQKTSIQTEVTFNGPAK